MHNESLPFCRGSRVEGIFSSVEGTLSSVEGTLSRVPILFYFMEVSKENSIKLRIACFPLLSLLIYVYSVVTRDYDYPCVARSTFCFT